MKQLPLGKRSLVTESSLVKEYLSMVFPSGNLEERGLTGPFLDVAVKTSFHSSSSSSDELSSSLDSDMSSRCSAMLVLQCLNELPEGFLEKVLVLLEEEVS